MSDRRSSPSKLGSTRQSALTSGNNLLKYSVKEAMTILCHLILCPEPETTEKSRRDSYETIYICKILMGFFSIIPICKDSYAEVRKKLP